MIRRHAQALVLEELGAGSGVHTDIHGVDWSHYRYAVEVRPEGEAPVTPGIVHHLGGDEPRWTVPAKCPECGARVDQSAAEMSDDPRCEYCEKPLPRVHVRAHDLP